MINLGRILLLFAIVLISSPELKAQLNLKVGYNLSFAKASEVDGILERFNEENPWLDRRFKSLKTVNGIILGLRYRFATTAVDLSLYSRFKTIRAEGTDPASNDAYFRKFSLKSRGLSFGVEQFIGMFSLGITVDRDNFVLESQQVSEGDFSELIKLSDWSNHLFVSINTPKSNGLGLSIRPFIQIPWSKFSTDKLEEDLGYIPSGKEDSFFNYGIQIIFFNGK